MNNLLYASEEMFSSTQLVRQSKKIFDSLVNNKISKAIILRDGKPNFMLLNFKTYEKTMKEFYMYKEYYDNKNIKSNTNNKKDTQDTTINDPIENKIVINDNVELNKALKQVEELNLDDNVTKEVKQKLTNTKSTAEIKEFWN